MPIYADYNELLKVAKRQHELLRKTTPLKNLTEAEEEYWWECFQQLSDIEPPWKEDLFDDALSEFDEEIAFKEWRVRMETTEEVLTQVAWDHISDMFGENEWDEYELNEEGGTRECTN